jgi:hypothetical protein
MPARAALDIVSARNGSADAATSIARRAHLGALRSFAERLLIEKHPVVRGGKEPSRQDDAELPKDFWWAKGEAGLDQDWQTGDFGTWIGENERWDAVGVKFEHSGIEAMLAPPKPAVEEPLKLPPDKGNEQRRESAKGRPLEHNHPEVAAKTVLKLMLMPKIEQDRLTGPSVGATMREYYVERSGRSPHQDNLESYGESVLGILREYWCSQIK